MDTSSDRTLEHVYGVILGLQGLLEPIVELPLNILEFFGRRIIDQFPELAPLCWQLLQRM